MSKESTRNPLHTPDVESGRSRRSSSVIDFVVNLGVLPTPIEKPVVKPFVVNPSVAIVVFIVFVGDSSRGILFPALWPLCNSLGGISCWIPEFPCLRLLTYPPFRTSGSLVDMGYLVAMFSIGRLISATPFGYYCDRVRHKVRSLLLNTTSIKRNPRHFLSPYKSHFTLSFYPCFTPAIAIRKMPLVVASGIVVIGAAIWANAYQTQKLAVLYLGQVW